MSEYYCSHKPPCCPQTDKLKARLEAAEYALMRFQIIPLAERTRGIDEALERWRKSKGEEAGE